MSAEPSDPEPTQQSESQVENDPTPSFGGWFSSLVQSAKDTVNKSADTLESIKRDLSEFKDAVQTDTTSMVYSTASIVKSTITEIGNTVNEIGSLGSSELEEDSEQGDSLKVETELQSDTNKIVEAEVNESSAFNLEAINSWTNILTDKAKTTLSIVKDTLVDSIFINRDFMIDELDDEPYVIKDDQIIAINNWKEMLHKLQVDPNTYYRESSGPPEDFDLWLTKFNLMNYQKQMEYLLENVPEIKKYHSDLVPQALSDSDFWHRYYYMVYQLKEEQKRLILETNEETTTIDSPANKKEANSVNIKYLTEEDSVNETKNDNKSKISRSSTEDWEKMDNSNSLENAVSKETDKSSSDDDRDWVKCE